MPAIASNSWLVVENDDDDSFLMRRALRRAQPEVQIYWAKDGFEAKSFLLGEAAAVDRARLPLPGLIVSDLKMPRLTGLELLAWARRDPLLAKIPFVLLTSSSSYTDRECARALGADEYLVKPSSYHDLLALVEGLSVRFGPGSR
jgi:CheY-like chemotaxis protein